MDSSTLRYMQSMTKYYDDLVPRYLRDALKQQRQLQKFADSVTGPLVKELHSVRQKLDGLTAIADQQRQIIESSKRWTDALAIVQSELPKRGWYLTGQEAGRLTERLAKLAAESKWPEIDQLLLDQASQMKVNVDAFAAWLTQKRVRDCCVNRVRLFLKARDEEEHEVATLVGVPLIDELSRALYEGKDFTTKRNKQAKPQMANKTASGTGRLNHYCEGFVGAFGLIHQDVEVSRAEDEDYFNRSAILHGMMRRSYGPKDSAKTFMTLMFLVFAQDEQLEPQEAESP